METSELAEATGGPILGLGGPDGASSNPIELEVVEDSSESRENIVQGEETDAEPAIRVKRFGTIMNLLNSLMGAGILSVPSSLASTGVIVSVVLILICVVLAEVATVMVIRLQIDSGSAGYDELAFRIGGRYCSLALSIFNMIFMYTSILAYLIIGGDMIISWLDIANIDITALWPRAGMILAYSLILPVALTIPRSIGFLSYFSAATVGFIGLFFIAIIAKGFVMLPREGIHESVTLAKFDMGVFSAFSIYTLAFALPCTCLTIINPYNPDVKKRTSATMIAMGITTVLVIVPAVISYLIYGKTTDGNVLNSFPNSDILITIVRVGFFFVVTFSYPLIAQLLLASWSQIFFKENDPVKLSNGKRVIVQIPTHLVPVVIAMFMPQAKPILAVGGSLGGIMTNFLYPVVLWYLFFKPPVNTLQFWGLVAFGIFGVFTLVVATYQSILDVIAAFSSIKN